MDRMRAGIYLENQINCNYEMYTLFGNPYCLFLVHLLLVKIFKHTHNSGEHRKPHPLYVDITLLQQSSVLSYHCTNTLFFGLECI